MTEIGILSNRYQGNHKKVLCVCSAGLLRSPTTAEVLSQSPYNYNTRSAGIANYAFIPVTAPMLCWAEEIVVMSQNMEATINQMLDDPNIQVFKRDEPTRVINLNIPDNYPFRDPELIELIKERYEKATLNNQGKAK